MSPESIAVSENDISAFERNFGQTESRILDLDRELDGVTLSEADVRRETERATKAEEAAALLERQSGGLAGKLERLKTDTEKAEALRLDHEKRRARHLLAQQLSQDPR